MATTDGAQPAPSHIKSVDNLVATEKMADSDEASTPSLWTEHNFCKFGNVGLCTTSLIRPPLYSDHVSNVG